MHIHTCTCTHVSGTLYFHTRTITTNLHSKKTIMDGTKELFSNASGMAECGSSHFPHIHVYNYCCYHSCGHCGSLVPPWLRQGVFISNRIHIKQHKDTMRLWWFEVVAQSIWSMD